MGSAFVQLVEKAGSHSILSVDPDADGYYIPKNYHRWAVFSRERGSDYDCMGFPSESDALIYLAEKLNLN